MLDAMAPAFCVIEILHDDDGRPSDYRFLEANARFAEHSGLSDVVGRTIRELVPGIEEYWIDRYADVAVRGVPLRFEESAAALGRTFEVDALPLGPAAPWQLAVFFSDVTERRRAEAALRESERRFREMADHAPVMLWVTGADGRCTFLNRPWYDFTGQTEAEALGDGFGWLDAVHPDDRAESARVFHEATVAERSFRLDYRLRHRDGTYRWCIDAAAPRVVDGRFAGFIGSVVEVHDRRMAEARVRASETLLSAVLDALPVGVIIADASGRIVRDNAANRALWGVPPDTTSWEQYGEWVGWWPATGARIAAHEWGMARALRAGETVRGELVACLPFGTQPPGAPVPSFAEAGARRYFLNNAAPVRDETGAIVGAVVAEQDVTRQIAAETERERLVASLERERARLAEAFDRAPSFAVIYRGPEHRFEYVNAAYYQLVGHRPVLDRPLDEAIPEAREQGFTALLDEVLTTGRTIEFRETPVDLERTPGSPRERRFVDMVFQPLADADGTVTGVLAHGVDVTGHVAGREESERLLAAERALRQRVERLQALTADLSGARSMADVARVALEAGVRAAGTVRGTILRYHEDDGAFELLAHVGYGDDEIAPWRRFSDRPGLPAGDAVRTRAPVILGGRAEVAARYPAIAHWAEATGYEGAAILPLLVAGGDADPEGAGARAVAPGGVLGLLALDFVAARPIADDEIDFLLALARVAAQALERALAYDAAQRARREAEAANRAKSDFLANMSHELRTPLNAIGGHAQLIDIGIHGPVSGAQRDALARIGRAQQHLLSLITDVLDYAKLEAGRVEYAMETVDLRTLLPEVAALLAPQFALRTQRFTVAAPTAPCPVLADREKLVQVLLNLLSNASKFTGDGGTVTVDVERDEAAGTVRIRVADTGIGIAPERMEAAFAPFVQVDSGHTRAHGGTGLGLAISRDFARGMGGDLTATSAPGEGSTFVVVLRAAEPHDVRGDDGRPGPDDRRQGRDRRSAARHADATDGDGVART